MAEDPLDRERRLAAAGEVAEVARGDAEAEEAAASAAVRRRMAEVTAHAFERATGHSPAEWQQAAQAAQDARDAAGWDPRAPVGSPAHPEVLVDGWSVSGSRGPAALEQAQRARYEQDGIAAQLARNQAEAEAWERDPVIVRARALAAGSSPAGRELRRSGVPAGVVVVPRRVPALAATVDRRVLGRPVPPWPGAGDW